MPCQQFDDDICFVLAQHTELDFNSAEITVRHVILFKHIILTPSAFTPLIWTFKSLFDLTWLGIKSMIYYTQGEHDNHSTTEAVYNIQKYCKILCYDLHKCGKILCYVVTYKPIESKCVMTFRRVIRNCIMTFGGFRRYCVSICCKKVCYDLQKCFVNLRSFVRNYVATSKTEEVVVWSSNIVLRCFVRHCLMTFRSVCWPSELL